MTAASLEQTYPHSAGIAKSRRGTAADEPTSTTSAACAGSRQLPEVTKGNTNNTLGENHGRKNRQDRDRVPVHERHARPHEPRLVAEPVGHPGAPPQLRSVRS